MTIGISANPGQTVIVALQIIDLNGERIDGYVPQIDFVINPAGSQFTGYPENMARLSEGLYNSSIVIPSGLAAVGTYLVSVSWSHPNTGFTQSELFLINAALPFGTSSVSPA